MALTAKAKAQFAAMLAAQKAKQGKGKTAAVAADGDPEDAIDNGADEAQEMASAPTSKRKGGFKPPPMMVMMKKGK